MSARLDGARAFGRTLERVGRAVTKSALADAAATAFEPVRRAAAENAPRRTGALAEGIILELVRQDATRAVVHVGPAKDVWYGIFAEFGTRHHPPHPFLRPAADHYTRRVFGGLGFEFRRRILAAAR